ncbi:acyltransferase [Pseudomonas sp. Cab53]|uniref:acyltransferase family protein n=1 Tax=Pseudomonas sp. Cab53 TaxID=2678258 RepID=UPI001BB42A3F|nr:acyltransferase family protein [Pseudomonas sp. Cab53]BBP64265.1 acyltransferase [Pseudomonas sp. Cab53]
MNFRLDIQALRGLAVAFVVMDHLGFTALKAGFLGVDIFFVISGYLITGIIASKIASGDFRLSEFYYKRAKRLVPAVYVTILATCIGAYLLLTPMENRNLLSQVAGAVTYTTNFVLLNQTGYFDADASTKPLLHLWSLAVEEQYYLIFPLILILSPARLWLRIVITVLIGSLLACLYLKQTHPSATFFLLPTRCWELLIGSGGYLAAQKFNIKIPRPVFLLAILAVLIIPTMEIKWGHPGPAAVVVCLSTLFIIWANSTIANTSIFIKPLVKLGDISYSLYLVHWPVIVFAHAVLPNELTLFSQISLFLVSLLCAGVLYIFVEQPSRRSLIPQAGLTWTITLGAAVLVSIQYTATRHNNNQVDFDALLRPNYGLDRACDNYLFKNDEKCRTSTPARNIVWGDSYAMHTIEGVKNHRKGGIAQATYSACPPFLDTAPYNPARADAGKLANYCIAFNDTVFSAIKADKTIETVILAASFWQYTVPTNKMLTRDEQDKGSTRIVPTSLDQVENDLGRTISELKRIGKEVIVIGPPPSVGNENISCMQQQLSNSTTAHDCTIPLKNYREYNAGVLTLLDTIETKYAIRVIRLSNALCDDTVCRTVVDGVPMYRDSGHLSYVGSAKAFDILANTKNLW